MGIAVRRKEAGQTLVFVAIGLVALMGFAGLGVDMGILRYQKRLQQSAADAAALAGASNLASSSGGIISGAQAASAANGYTDNSGGATCTANSGAIGCVSVTVNHPPASGPHSGDGKYVEVLVAAVHPTYFMNLLNIQSESITARAVATNASGGAQTNCLYTLSSFGNGIVMSGSAKIDAPNCGVLVNSNLVMNGVELIAGSIGVSGSYSGSATSPMPVTGMPAAGDPLNYLNQTAPSSACSGNSRVTINGNDITQSVPAGDYCRGVTISGSDNTVTLNPGVFGGITINGTGHNVSFNPGLYVISGNTGFVVGNGSSGIRISGTGVSFYAGASAGNISLNGNDMTVNLSAPTSGALTGMLFWQSPSNSQTLTLNGNSSSTLEGIMYLPEGQVTINGTNGAPTYFMIVTDSLLVNGALNLRGDISILAGGLPIKNAVLVE